MLRAMWQAFSIGNVLGTGFKVWLRNLAPFLLMFSVIELPFLAWQMHTADEQAALLAATRHHPSPQEAMDLMWQTLRISLGGVAIESVLGILAAAAVTYGVIMELTSKRAGIVACVTNGVRRLLPAVGVGLLASLCILGGCIALIVPGIMLACGLWVATQASVIEKPGITGALKRSFELTKGHRLEIFALLVIVAMMTGAVNMIAQKILVPGAGGDGDDETASFTKLIYVQWAVTVLFGSLRAVFASVTYYYLRAEKEGTSATQLASVFD